MTDVLARDLAAIDTMVRSAANGDEVAFAQLVAEHHSRMARVAFVICGDVETSRDAVQSAWAIAWRRLRSLRDPSHVHAWLVAIAANEARQVVRRRRRVTMVRQPLTLPARSRFLIRYQTAPDVGGLTAKCLPDRTDGMARSSGQM